MRPPPPAPPQALATPPIPRAKLCPSKPIGLANSTSLRSTCATIATKKPTTSPPTVSLYLPTRTKLRCVRSGKRRTRECSARRRRTRVSAKMKLANFPEDIVELYNLKEKATDNDYVYAEVRKGILERSICNSKASCGPPPLLHTRTIRYPSLSLRGIRV